MVRKTRPLRAPKANSTPVVLPHVPLKVVVVLSRSALRVSITLKLRKLMRLRWRGIVRAACGSRTGGAAVHQRGVCSFGRNKRTVLQASSDCTAKSELKKLPIDFPFAFTINGSLSRIQF